LPWILTKLFFIQFTNKSTCTSDIQITYEDKKIHTAIETKFLGLFINNTLSWKTTLNVKESHNRPSVVQSVPGGLGSQIPMTFGTCRWWCCQTHALAVFIPNKYFWYSFSLGAESTPGLWNSRKEYVTEKSSDTTGNRSQDCLTSSAAPKPLRYPRHHNIECIKSKLSSACYAMWSVKLYVSLNTLKMIYYSYFHCVMTYGLSFWGHSSDSIKIFRLQKKIIRIMIVCKSSDSCRKLFSNLEILPLLSQYILSLLLPVIRNRNQFQFWDISHWH